MSNINEILKPANTPRPIVLHVGADDPAQAEDAYSELEYQAGFYYPIIKVRNTTFTKPSIKMFDVNFGYSFLPKLNFTIEDTNKSFQETDYPVKNDIVTVYIGNQYDTYSKPIHLDFMINNIVSYGVDTVTHVFECSLAIEKAFENMNIADELDSIGVIQKLCKEMKLGLLTNIDVTADSYKYRQYSKTNIDFLKSVCSKVYTSDEQTIHYFIDQYYRLNVIDINSVLSGTAVAEPVVRDLTFFQPLDEKEEMVFNNSQYNTRNKQFKFGQFRVENKAFDTYNQTKPIESMVIKKDYSTGKLSSNFKNTKVIKEREKGQPKDITANNATNSKQVQSVAVLGEHNENVQQLGNNANKTRYEYLNNNSLTIRMNTPSNLININKLIVVEVYTSDQYTQLPFKPTDKNLTTTNEAISTDGSERINETLSSDYSVTGISYIFIDGDNAQLYQELKLIRKIWKKQYYNDDEEIDWSEATVGLPSAYTMPDPPPPPPPVDNTGGSYGYTGTFGDWMAIAKGEIGTQEVAGTGSNPKIEEYHKVGGGLGAGTTDDVPWCGSFVGWCMVKAGYAKASSSASAQAWANFGAGAQIGTYGAIVVLKLQPSSMTRSGYHVGFCAGMNGSKVSVLGGNQGNSVRISQFDAGKVIAWRVPQGAPLTSVSNSGNSVAPTGPLRISQNGINFMKNREGCKLQSYQDSGGVWTIGYGHTKTARPFMNISYQQAEMLFRQDLTFFENYVNNNVSVKLTQAMFDALVSFIYNVGQARVSKTSPVGILLSQRRYLDAANKMTVYNTSKGKTLQGLVTRRAMERSMFLSQGTNPI